ncbi:peptide chain release factor N(5)-glutamine methyltransferase [Candidatus Bipolaricaulota bacterium]|nr:peptide chain release factor N(5)-glutamine methyltransferase [Candidatus Bipolaricaulota bacterium]
MLPLHGRCPFPIDVPQEPLLQSPCGFPLYGVLEFTTRIRYGVQQERALRVVGWGGTLAAEWTIREVLNWTRGYFKSAGITQPRLEAEILLAHALDVDRLHLYLTPDKPLTPDERDRYRTVVKERQSGTPLQHLTGEVSFYGLRFRASKNALIPRPETEELLDHALRLAPRERDIRCLDLGTGSGIIAVCLARYLPRAHVTALDISPAALQLAATNAAMNDVGERIEFMESDWFTHVTGRFDLIAANPPYVDREELAGLPQEVRDHEPHEALDGGVGGLEQIEQLLRGVPKHLAPGGRLLMEIGASQGAQVVRMMTEVGLSDASALADLAGKDRFAVAREAS